MAAGDITIKNTNKAKTYEDVRLWNTGVVSATDPEATATVAATENDNLLYNKMSGLVTLRFWELDQYMVLSDISNDKVGTGNNDGNQIVIAAPATEAEKNYYLKFNGVAGLEVTVAGS